MAAKLVCVPKLLDSKAFLMSGDCTKESIDSQGKLAKDIINGYKHMTRALRRGFTDMASALTCVKTSQSLRSRENHKASQRKGRKALKLPPNCSTSDPSSLKIYKSLENLD